MRKRCSGASLIELTLIAPWVFLLFIGAVDWGFYASALVSMQAAARSAVLYTSSSSSYASSSTAACNIVVAEMRKLPNVGSSVTCPASNPSVTAESITGPDGAPASRVTIVYRSVTLIPMPGLLKKRFTIHRIATMRIRG